MNTFSYNVVGAADVKIRRDGRGSLKIEVTSMTDTITIEIKRGSLSILEDSADALARKTGQRPAPSGTVHFES